MKKIFAIIAFMLLLSIPGCGSSQNQREAEGDVPISLVIIAGRHANANMYTEDMLNSVRPLISSAVQEYEDSDGYHAKADVAVIVSDGSPQRVLLEAEGENTLSFSAPNLKKFEEGKGQIVDNIIAFLTSDTLIADDPDVDLLKAISQAQDILNSRNGTERHILILDTGVTTSGYLNMAETDIVDSDLADILSKIQDGIPNLDDTKVTFVGLGNVCEPQGTLDSNTAKEKLLELWTSIIVDSGHGSLTDKLYISENYGVPMKYDESNPDGYPDVGTVQFPSADGKIAPIGINYEPPEPKDPESKPEPYIVDVFHTSDLGFNPNKATFRNKDQAYSALNSQKDVLENVVNKTDSNIIVVGSIAKVTPDRTDKHNDTSRDRAQAVADILETDYGVPKERIIVIDAGVTTFSWRDADESDGPKQENRVVAVFSDNCDKLVQELRDAGYID